MCSADLPDVIVLGQRDPELRVMGRDAEEYLRSLLSEPPHYGQVYVRDGMLDGYSITRVDRKRLTLLSLVFRDPEAAISLLEFRMARLTERRRFADLQLEITAETAAVLKWSSRRGALIRSCGRHSGRVIVTFSRPRASKEGATTTR